MHGGALVVCMSALLASLCQILQVLLVILQQSFCIDKILSCLSDLSAESLNITFECLNGNFVLIHLRLCVSNEVFLRSACLLPFSVHVALLCVEIPQEVVQHIEYALRMVLVFWIIWIHLGGTLEESHDLLLFGSFYQIHDLCHVEHVLEALLEVTCKKDGFALSRAAIAFSNDEIAFSKSALRASYSVRSWAKRTLVSSRVFASSSCLTLRSPISVIFSSLVAVFS